MNDRVVSVPMTDNLVVHVVRLEIVSHVTAIPAERIEEAREYVVQRHVVIAGNDQLGPAAASREMRARR